MTVQLTVLKEEQASETRVAASPETVKKLKAMGVSVTVEAGAGVKSGFDDNDFTRKPVRNIAETVLICRGDVQEIRFFLVPGTRISEENTEIAAAAPTSSISLEGAGIRATGPLCHCIKCANAIVRSDFVPLRSQHCGGT